VRKAAEGAQLEHSEAIENSSSKGGATSIQRKSLTGHQLGYSFVDEGGGVFHRISGGIQHSKRRNTHPGTDWEA